MRLISSSAGMQLPFGNLHQRMYLSFSLDLSGFDPFGWFHCLYHQGTCTTYPWTSRNVSNLVGVKPSNHSRKVEVVGFWGICIYFYNEKFTGIIITVTWKESSAAASSCQQRCVLWNCLFPQIWSSWNLKEQSLLPTSTLLWLCWTRHLSLQSASVGLLHWG